MSVIFFKVLNGLERIMWYGKGYELYSSSVWELSTIMVGGCGLKCSVMVKMFMAPPLECAENFHGPPSNMWTIFVDHPNCAVIQYLVLARIPVLEVE